MSRAAPIDSSSRDRILAAASVEFAEHGLSGARIDRIAGRAGVNKAMIYYHVGSKEELHRAVIDEIFSSLVARLGADLPGAADGEAMFAMISDTYTRMFLQRPEIVRVMLREIAQGRAETLDRIASFIRGSGVHEHIVSTLRREIDSGRLREVDVVQTAVSFIVLNLGYLILSPVLNRVWGISDTQDFLSDRQEAVLDLFLNGVRTR
jgi:AcrR family transcriptional regulator